MKVVLTGAQGFIGSLVANEIADAGHDVLPLGRGHRMHDMPWQDLERFGPDACVHAAWIATPGIYQDSPLNAFHRQWSWDLVTRLCDMGVKHFVMLGTCAEYAPADHPLNEDADSVCPRTSYAREKHALHTLIRPWLQARSASLAWLRIFFPYGPSEHPGRLISTLSRHFKEGTFSPELLREPAAERDYIHVSDVARAISTITEARVNGIINVGSGIGVRLAALANLVSQRYGGAATPFEASPSLAVSGQTIVADNTKLKRLGWVPRYDLAAGLRTYPDARDPSA